MSGHHAHNYKLVQGWGDGHLTLLILFLSTLWLYSYQELAVKCAHEEYLNGKLLDIFVDVCLTTLISMLFTNMINVVIMIIYD